MLDMDMVSNFISAAMLLKELDSIIDDLICWTEEEAKEEEDSDMLCISFLVITDELMEAEDSLCVITADPDEKRSRKEVSQNFRVNNNESSPHLSEPAAFHSRLGPPCGWTGRSVQ